MAEIKIEKKKPIWPWILGVLIILAAVYFFWYSNDQSNDDNNLMEQDTLAQQDEDRVMENSDTYGTEQTMAAYLSYIDNEKMGVDHEYTNGALIKLIDATEAEAQTVNVDINADLQQARDYASQVTNDPQSLKHADKIKSTATTITKALRTIQQQKFPDLGEEVATVSTAAEAINAATPTLEQKDNVKRFFTEAGNLLQQMDENEQ